MGTGYTCPRPRDLNQVKLIPFHRLAIVIGKLSSQAGRILGWMVVGEEVNPRERDCDYGTFSSDCLLCCLPGRELIVTLRTLGL